MALKERNNEIEAMYYLSPLQEGLLFHHVAEGVADPYCDQAVCELEGTVDRSAFEAAWGTVVSRHPVLRTAILWEKVSRPIQVVRQQVPLAVDYEDWRAQAPKPTLLRSQHWQRRIARKGSCFDKRRWCGCASFNWRTPAGICFTAIIIFYWMAGVYKLYCARCWLVMRPG